MNIGQKFNIRRSTKQFLCMWSGMYYRTVVFLDEYWFGTLYKSSPLLTYKKVALPSKDFKRSYEVREYPLPATPTVEALDLHNKGVVTGMRQSTMYAVREIEVIDNRIYQKLINP